MRPCPPLRILLAFAAVLAALLALATPARAEDQATKLAKKHYQKGEKLFALGRFDEALVAYEDAYEAKSLPGFLFNIGQCHRNIGDLDAAIFSFKKYLELAPEAENHDDVVDLIKELEEERQREKDRERDKILEPDPPPMRPERRSRPIYKKWWFWSGVAVVAAGAGTGTYLLLREDNVPDTDLGHVVFK